MKSDNALVSILVPTRNRGHLLGNALRSIFSQTYENFEVIVCNNNSQDETSEILAGFSDPRMKVLTTKEDLPMLENWGRGVKYIRGKYFVRLDDDNEFLPDFIENAVSIIEGEVADVVMFNNINVYSDRFAPAFDVDPRSMEVSPEQWIGLEFFTKIDSNYQLYRMDSIRDCFGDDRFYQTSLPDRFLAYSFAAYGARACYSGRLAGITRFDYETPKQRAQSFVFEYIDYDARNFAAISTDNCHANYAYHRVKAVSIFRSSPYCSNQIDQFFEEVLLSKGFEATAMKIGHLYMRDRLRRGEVGAFIRYFGTILVDLSSNKGSTINGISRLSCILLVSLHFFRTLKDSIFLNAVPEGSLSMYDNCKAAIEEGKEITSNGDSIFGCVASVMERDTRRLPAWQEISGKLGSVMRRAVM